MLPQFYILCVDLQHYIELLVGSCFSSLYHLIPALHPLCAHCLRLISLHHRYYRLLVDSRRSIFKVAQSGAENAEASKSHTRHG